MEVKPKKILFILIGLCWWSFSLSAQECYGIIRDSTGQVISDCYLLVLDVEDNRIIDYAVPNAVGEYQVAIPLDTSRRISIRCQGLAYETQTKDIDWEPSTSRYEVNFQLRLRKRELEEVVIVAERIAIKVNNDTVVYDVSQFRGVEDRKIINVLKNMPGITVDERSGMISYKGKPVETILLDGDDLFGDNYTVGARNISSDIVDKVEAIEDYHENKLKKGLKRSEKVALNLKFKEDKIKLSGEVGAALGLGHFMSNVNAISLSKRYKGFGVFQVNNISINETSFLPATYRSENREEIDRYGVDFFRESSATQMASFPRSYINNLKFGNYNNLFTFSEKVKLKSSIAAFGDQTEYAQSIANRFTIAAQEVETSNEIENTATPSYFTFDNELNVDLTKTSLLKYTNRFVRHRNDFHQTNLQNKNTLFDTGIGLSKSYFQQKLNYSNRFSDKELFEVNLLHTSNHQDQRMSLNSPEPVSFDSIVLNEQESEGRRSILESKLLYLRKINKGDIELSLQHTYDTWNSDMVSGAVPFGYLLENNSVLGTGEFNYQVYKKMKLSGKLAWGYADRRLKNKQEETSLQEKGDFLNLEAGLGVKLNPKNNVNLTAQRNHQLNDYYYLFSHPILVDARTIVRNRPALAFRQMESLTANYAYYDIPKQFSFSFSTTYRQEDNFMLATQRISERISLLTYFQTPLSKSDIDLSTATSFFIDGLNNKVELSANANFSQYYNSLQEADIRAANASVYNASLSLNSAFLGFFNYRSSLSFTYVESEQAGIAFPFINRTLTAGLTTIFKFSKRTYCKLENELLLPDGQQLTGNQFFMDFSFNHVREEVEFFVLARNLLNQDNFSQISTTEFSRSVYSLGLFPRYVVLGANFQF
ncbi:MAG TPA: hypothetical protein VJ953_20175 [Saprospiraceae bacterium]|nr:hypothetical protein [Saprospiraceae bacterium]